MNAQEQRIAIAEHLGWTFKGDIPTDPKGVTWPILKMSVIPTYESDLNAMYWVEDRMPVHTWQRYTQHIGAMTGTRRFCVVHANAAQRAEAYLKTIGKWKEESK